MQKEFGNDVEMLCFTIPAVMRFCLCLTSVTEIKCIVGFS
jgi:hypothetical protein